LIWHIDDNQPGNTDEHHYKVALMQADGKRDMEHNVNRGDAGDPYPGSSNNRTFNATSNPSSKSYGNADSGVAVSAIGANGPTISVQIQVKRPGASPASGRAKPKPAARAKPKGKMKSAAKKKAASSRRVSSKRAGRKRR